MWAGDEGSGHATLLERFCSGSDAFRNARFKILPSVSEGSWLVKVLLALTPTLTLTLTTNPNPNPDPDPNPNPHPDPNQVDRGTWFGDQPDYTFGIQIMPLTPITELLVRP